MALVGALRTFGAPAPLTLGVRPLMNKRSGDAAIGVLVIGASGLLIWAVSGYRGIAFVAFLATSGAVVIRLFESPSKWSKVFAIFMLPALLLTYLKPKKKPSTEREQD